MTTYWIAMLEHGEHQRITAAGWAYRTNDRGWVIYLNPQTGRWHTHSDAISIIQAKLFLLPDPKSATTDAPVMTMSEVFSAAGG